VKKVIFLLLFILVFLAACDEQVTNEYLIGGEWVAISGYEDGEIKGEPQCPIIKGLKFMDQETVYIEHGDQDFEYNIEDSGTIEFFAPSHYMAFETKIIDEDGMVIEGLATMEGEICYMERQTEIDD